MNQALGTLVERGGPVVVVLLGLSVLALAIALLKLGQFARARLWSSAWIGEAVAAARSGDTERALELIGAHPGPVARVLVCAVRGRADADQDDTLLREEVERVAMAEIASLESNLRGLDSIASLAPLLGLLGTVLGMIRAFIRLEAAGSRVDPALLAGGIWEALLTTAVGLAVAIPTLAVLAWLESQVDRTRRRMEDSATRVLTAAPPSRTIAGHPVARELPGTGGGARRAN